jgi:UrcA family protein
MVFVRGLCASAVLLATAAAAPVLAAEAGSLRILHDGVRVEVGDLDFADARDVATFRKRIARVAGALCPPELSMLERSACFRNLSNQVVDALPAEDHQKLMGASGRMETWWTGH